MLLKSTKQEVFPTGYTLTLEKDGTQRTYKEVVRPFRYPEGRRTTKRGEVIMVRTTKLTSTGA